MINTMRDIILVEDNSADIELLLDALKENNISSSVKVLKDGEEALDYIFNTGQYKDCGMCENPQLFILDLNLPKINGLEILRRIREDVSTRMIPVMILTSSFADGDRIESYRLGVNHYMVKPLDFDYYARNCVTMSIQAILMSGASTNKE
jgi:two-component system response regulator